MTQRESLLHVPSAEDVDPSFVRQSRFMLAHARCRGILWDTFDTYPDVPEGTFFAKTSLPQKLYRLICISSRRRSV